MLRLDNSKNLIEITRSFYAYCRPYIEQMCGESIIIDNNVSYSDFRSLNIPAFKSLESPFYLHYKYNKDDNLSRRIIGEFNSKTINAFNTLRSQWDMKSRFSQNFDNFLDDIICSLFQSGNKKYELFDIINCVRESLLFTYEDRPVGNAAIVTNNFHTLYTSLLQHGFIVAPLNKKIDFREHLRLSKTWHRLSHPSSVIYILTKSTLVSHIAFLPSINAKTYSDWEFVPQPLCNIRDLLSGRDLIVNASGSREFYFASKDFVYRWNYAKWHRVSGPSLSSLLGDIIDPDVLDSLSKTIRILVRNRQGGLFLFSRNSLNILIENSSGGIAREFRDRRLFNVKEVEPDAIARFASIDGAMIISPHGKVKDAGRIYNISGSPSDSGETGARTAAAKSASKHGVAIKISQDGPISVYKDGEMIRKFN